MKINERIEEVYNMLSYNIKEDIGFPAAYLFLTTEQERFIIELFEREREAVKQELFTLNEEMKELIDEI